MKAMYGKLGFGLAAAVAAVGLMSAGVQTAQAQLELSSPVITVDANSSVNNPIYDWTYTLNLTPSVASDGVNSEFGLALASDNMLTSSGASGSDYTFTPTSGTWTTSFNDGDFYGTDKVTSGTVNGGVVGTLVLTTTTLNATPVGVYGFIATGSSGSPTGISAVLSNSNSQATDFASYNTETGGTGTSPNVFGESVYTPSLSGAFVLSPLPLPAAFWPGLMTLGGMAVVGGLRLRRRSV